MPELETQPRPTPPAISVGTAPLAVGEPRGVHPSEIVPGDSTGATNRPGGTPPPVGNDPEQAVLGMVQPVYPAPGNFTTRQLSVAQFPLFDSTNLVTVQRPTLLIPHGVVSSSGSFNEMHVAYRYLDKIEDTLGATDELPLGLPTLSRGMCYLSHPGNWYIHTYQDAGGVTAVVEWMDIDVSNPHFLQAIIDGHAKAIIEKVNTKTATATPAITTLLTMDEIMEAKHLHIENTDAVDDVFLSWGNEACTVTNRRLAAGASIDLEFNEIPLQALTGLASANTPLVLIERGI